MKKPIALLILLLLTFPISTSAEAANKTTVLTQAFQKFLTDGEVSYTKNMAAAKALYEPQISAAQANLLAAQTTFSQVNQVTILKTTTHASTGTIAIDAVSCPVLRSECKDPVYKSNEFKAGEVSTVYPLIGGEEAFSIGSTAQMNLGILQIIDLQVKDGLISLNNATAYNTAVSTIRTQYQNRLTLVQQYATMRSAAATVRESVQSMKPTIDSAILSTKRAALNSATFEKAFVTAFKFDYNAQRLNDLARSPWGYITSLKALNDAVSITKSSMQADAVSARYTYTAANKINAIYGNLFISEPEFKSSFKLVTEIYKSATGITLSTK
jgi:hypothetical protein